MLWHIQTPKEDTLSAIVLLMASVSFDHGSLRWECWTKIIQTYIKVFEQMHLMWEALSCQNSDQTLMIHSCISGDSSKTVVSLTAFLNCHTHICCWFFFTSQENGNISRQINTCNKYIKCTWYVLIFPFQKHIATNPFHSHSIVQILNAVISELFWMECWILALIFRPVHSQPRKPAAFCNNPHLRNF